MKAAHLDGGHREDLQDLLTAFERDFGIRFEEGEFGNRFTLGEVCDYVVGKIPLEDDGFCTTQSAFFKLRAAIAGNGYKGIVTPQTPLANVLPQAGMDG